MAEAGGIVLWNANDDAGDVAVSAGLIIVIVNLPGKRDFRRQLRNHHYSDATSQDRYQKRYES